MRQLLLPLSLIGAIAIAVSPVQVFGQCVAPISWGPTFAYETSYANNESAVGSQLVLVGKIDCFSGIFGDIDPNGATEYTVKIFNLTSTGTVVTPIPPVGLTAYETHYDGGTVEVWADPTPDAVHTINPPNGDVPSTFMNGSLFLEANLDGLDVTFFLQTATGAFASGNFDTGSPAGAAFTANGSAANRVNVGGAGCPLRLTGLWSVKASSLPAGYTADLEGKIDILCPVQTDDGSWGMLKSLYR